MITITRSLARQLRAVFRRTGALCHGSPAWIVFLATPAGLKVQFQAHDIALEYSLPGLFQP